ncbi:low molecular weight phosphotyrosine protein phosphatase [Gordonia amarae]|uniref:protein-tyrosine-phosphatase n=2 Tax=Gordonia amarae TaxID=36821 RepID=G7GPX1_9ACTN|nr:low molecular weight protein-tyrosine-phosphatase [Gordonia amarae]MCS3879664.1 protein-tyrosine phosphatase [Gordonia amarae]QHN18107.1 low molecular weight phosphotyrosine protein phosphatase [Gordonia amarae]QHN22628.1 low molecular weight phosphotyrosine protein phosphatase [Gordonia amarae]QHN31494.1 low molecular weight phosphotyrosine protein phosphatase [Gordonia amarae]QHN40238.1 low molecular weight phosphotyrosine protein phosphatase [Gordonia amarae]
MSDDLHICFVCTGNICRSAMAQNIFRSALAGAGLDRRVRVTSCGTSGFHTGEPADNRARTELLANGYPDDHVAAQLSPEHYDADLFVAADHGHVRDLERKRLGDRVRLLRSFDPSVGPGDLDLSDPYYGTPEDFAETRIQIEAAIPGLVDWAAAALDEL